MTKILAIYCSGGLGQGVFDLAQRLNNKNNFWSNIIFIDDVRQESEFYSSQLLSFTNFQKKYSPQEAEIAIANGEPSVRKALFEKIAPYPLATLLDETCIISPSSKIDKGVILYPFCYLASNCHIQSNTIICSHSTIGHDTSIGQHCTLVGHVNIAGCAKIHDMTYIGMGAQIKDRLTLGENSVIGIGSVVYKDVPANVRTLGNPSRIIMDNTKNIFNS